jgi:hypothetical protein
MGEACSMHERCEMRTKFLLESLKRRNHSEDPGVCWRIILKWILRDQGVDWIYQAQDRDRWRILVNAVMNLRVI